MLYPQVKNFGHSNQVLCSELNEVVEACALWQVNGLILHSIRSTGTAACQCIRFSSLGQQSRFVRGARLFLSRNGRPQTRRFVFCLL